MDFTLVSILSLCIIIPAFLGLLRFWKITSIYRPFIFYIWLGLVNETVSYILIRKFNSNIINVNIYLLLEMLLLTWQFKKWKLFSERNNIFKAIIVVAIVGWLSENFIFSKITVFNSYFRIGYSTALTVMSIFLINRLIVSERRSLLKNPAFIICSAFVLYYTLNILSETFWLYGLSAGTIFRLSIYNISVITNFLALLLYSYAILWMPSKQRFTLPS